MNGVLLVTVVALAVRAAAAWMLGPGAFGPDAAGAEAAVVLGGHPYPFHPWLLGLVGDARVLNVVAGSLTAGAAAWMGQKIDAGPWGPGLVVACAPLLVHHSAMAGGDAAAVAAMSVAVALAWNGQLLVGGCLAGLALGIKPLALPLLPLLFVAMPLRGGGTFLMLCIGLAIGLVPTFSTLAPLLDPHPNAGLLGSWWLANDGAFARPEDWPRLLRGGMALLWEVPVWAGHPFLGGLALLGAAWPGPNRRARVVAFLVAAISLWLTASLLGDRLRWRYLAPATVGLSVLAGMGLHRAPWAALGLLWPTAALVSSLGTLRAQEDQITAPPAIPFADRIDARPMFEDASVCGAAQLRVLADELAVTALQDSEVVVIRLRDGREGDLTWPLQAARPDLRITRFHAGCCGERTDCSVGLLAHVMDGATLVVPAEVTGCTTELLGPAEQEIARPLSAVGTARGIWRVLEVEGPASQQDACQAVQAPRPVSEPLRVVPH